MSLLLVGISHRVAPVELRERVALSGEESAALARELATASGEAVCLSTCNRTELYLAGEESLANVADRAVATLADRSGLDEHTLRSVLYRLEDEAADDTDAGLSAIAVSVRTFLPAWIACRKSRSRSGPGCPDS